MLAKKLSSLTIAIALMHSLTYANNHVTAHHTTALDLVQLTPQSLYANMLAGSSIPFIFTLHNNSSLVPALFVHATLPSSWTDVTQDASNCNYIAPGGTCDLILTPGNTVHGLASITIQGFNVPAFSVSLRVLGSSFAYIANYSSNSVSMCQVNSATGLFENCQATGSNFTNPTGVAVAFGSTHAYITNDAGAGQSYVSHCSRNLSSGLLSNCTTVASGLDSLSNITVNQAGTLAYFIVGGINGSVQKCDINNTTGALTNCVSTGTPDVYVSPLAMSLGNFGDTAFITNGSTSGEVTFCHIQQTNDGVLNNCQNYSSPASQTPLTIARNINSTVAYVATVQNKVNFCQIPTTTAFYTNCVENTNGLSNPLALALDPTNTRLYIGNYGNADGTDVNVCDTDPTSGSLTNCRTAGTGFNGPRGIVLAD